MKVYKLIFGELKGDLKLKLTEEVPCTCCGKSHPNDMVNFNKDSRVISKIQELMLLVAEYEARGM